MVVAVNSKYRKMIKQVTPQPTTTTLPGPSLLIKVPNQRRGRCGIDNSKQAMDQMLVSTWNNSTSHSAPLGE